MVREVSVSHSRVVAGHCVKSSAHVALGVNDSFLAYRVSRTAIVVLDVSHSRGTATESLERMRVVDLESSSAPEKAEGRCFTEMEMTSTARESEGEVIFVRLHPFKDWMCVGAERYGLYLTSASAPELTAATRLPAEVVGEQVHAACFVSARGIDLMAFSSSFKGKTRGNAQHAHRLSLWSISDKMLLWRGAMDPLESMCAFPGEFTFAACAGPKVLLFCAQPEASGLKEEKSSSSSPRAGGSLTSDPNVTSGSGGGSSATRPPPSTQKFVLLSRLCSTVDELRDAEYVECDVYQGESSTDDGHTEGSPSTSSSATFTALTSSGYLVAFDCATGAVIRWMDCKVCPATTMRLSKNYVLLAGTMTRFFTTDCWEFCGKIKPDVPAKVVGSSYASKLFDSLYTGAVCIKSEVFLFSSNGELAVYEWRAGGTSATNSNTAGGTSNKIHFTRRYHYVAVSSAETQVQFFFPKASAAVAPTSSWCLWSPLCTRIFVPYGNLHATLPMDMTCATFHARTQTLVGFCSTTQELIVYAAEDAWREWARLDLSSENVSVCSLVCRVGRDDGGGSGSRHGDNATEDNNDFIVALCNNSRASGGGGTAAVPQSLLCFTCRWRTVAEGCRSLTLARATMTHPLRPLPRSLVAAELVSVTPQETATGSELGMYAVSQRSIASLDTGREVYSSSDVITCVCGAGADLIIASASQCVHLSCATCVARPVPLGDSLSFLLPAFSGDEHELRIVCYDAANDLIAIATRWRAVVHRLGSGECVRRIHHSDSKQAEWGGAIKAMTLRLTNEVVMMCVCDEAGLLSEYSIIANRSGASTSTERAAAPSQPTLVSTAISVKASAAPQDPAQADAGESTQHSIGDTRRSEERLETRRQRRSASASALSSRELTARFDALSGFYEQQKLQLDCPRTSRQLRRASCGACSASFTTSSGSLGDSHPAVAAAMDAHNEVVEEDEAKVTGSPERRQVGFTMESSAPRFSAVEVSALTVVNDSAQLDERCDTVMLTANSNENSGTGGPVPATSSPGRRGEVRVEPEAPTEDTVKYSSTEVVPFPPATRDRSVEDSPAPAPYAFSPQPVLSRPQDTARRAAQPPSKLARSLRASLLQLQEALEQHAAAPEVSAGGLGDSHEDGDDEDRDEEELCELAQLMESLSSALHARIQRRGARWFRDPTGTATAMSAERDEQYQRQASSGRESSVENLSAESYRTLFAELARIQEQNERLETQNTEILQQLASKQPR